MQVAVCAANLLEHDNLPPTPSARLAHLIIAIINLVALFCASKLLEAAYTRNLQFQPV